MAGIGTVDLAAAVSAAGGLGSIGCATMEPEIAAKTIRALRGLTDKPINVNFFCHVQARTGPDREEAWREHLLPYYRELGIDPEMPVPQVNIPSFDDVRCRIVEATKPEVVSFHFGLPDSTLLARVKAVGCRIMASATTVAEAVWLEERGVDIVIEHVGEATWAKSVRALARGGRLVTCGATTGTNGALNLSALFSKQLSILGSYMGTKGELLRAAPFFFAGQLKPVIDVTFPLRQAANAHRRMEESGQFGKIVLEVP